MSCDVVYRPVTRAEIVAEARKWLGMPFHHQGTNEHGIDCGGLVAVVGQALGQLPGYVHPTDYSRQPNGFMRQLMNDNFDRVGLRDALPGDIPFVAWAHEPQHIGVLSSDKGIVRIIHADERAGKVVEVTFGGRLLRRVHSIYRFRGVID